jgi:hypothetical protein
VRICRVTRFFYQSRKYLPFRPGDTWRPSIVRNSFHSPCKMQRSQEWIKVSLGELSVFYPQKQKGHKFTQKMRSLKNYRHPISMRTFVILSATGFSGICLFYVRAEEPTRSISAKPSGLQFQSALSESNSHNLPDTISSKSLPVPMREPGNSDPMKKSNIEKPAQGRKIQKAQTSLDPFRCSPATNSQTLFHRMALKPLLKRELWYVCR